MESLADQPPRPAKEKPAKTQDRVSLGKVEAEKVEAWLKQVNQSSKGFLSLTKSDVVNFLVRSHRDDFAPKELTQIRVDHYDPIRHITWITPQIKEALANGDMGRVAELQEELRGVELSVVREAMSIGAKGSSNKDDIPVRRRKSKSKLNSDESKTMPGTEEMVVRNEEIQGASLGE